jgi:acetoacetyl-CoA reductase
MAKRLALITGGMGGLGETISTKMADAGYGVAVTFSPSNKTASRWTAEMKSRGYEFRAYPCDVADYESCKACVENVAQDMGPVDILVNNAGITRDMTFRKMGKGDWDAVLRTNLDSVFNMTKQVCDGMVDRGWGRVINVSSVNGSKGAFGQTNYAAAKAGMHGFTSRSLWSHRKRDRQHNLARLRHEDSHPRYQNPRQKSSNSHWSAPQARSQA